MTEKKARIKWWGEFEVPCGQIGQWRIGPLTLWVQRQSGEWRVAYQRTDDFLDPTIAIDIPVSDRDLLEHETITRYATSGDDCRIWLSPMLADRSVVSRPQNPLSILPGVTIDVYISTPLWIRMEVGKRRQLLQELPVFRPSDTWFGTSTMEGELCYSSRTNARLNRENLPFWPHRAATLVRVNNLSDESLNLERLNLPVIYLSLYEASDLQLWTEDVHLHHEAGKDLMPLRLDTHKRQKRTMVKSSRRPAENVMVRAMISLFK